MARGAWARRAQGGGCEWTLVAIGLLAFTPAALAGQAVIRGTVRETGGQPLEAAEVILRPDRGGAKTGPDGRFAIGGIPAGTYLVTVRAIGFDPVEANAELRGNDTVTVTFELRRSVQVLESLHVEAPAKPVNAKMAIFEERRKAGFGRFLVRADIEKREHSTLSDILRMVGGMSFINRPFECGGGFAAAAGRGTFVLRYEQWMKCNGRFDLKAACYMTIYLDGAVFWTWGQPEIPDLDKIISLTAVEAIEVYRGPAELPIELQKTGSACGAVVLWTRS